MESQDGDIPGLCGRGVAEAISMGTTCQSVVGSPILKSESLGFRVCGLRCLGLGRKVWLPRGL